MKRYSNGAITYFEGGKTMSDTGERKLIPVKMTLYLYGLPDIDDLALHCVGESDHWQTRAVNKFVRERSSPYFFQGEIPLWAEGEFRKFCLEGLCREQALQIFQDIHNWPLFGNRMGHSLTCFSYHDGRWWFVSYRYPIRDCGTFLENMFLVPSMFPTPS